MRENVGHAEHSDDLRRFIAEGKKVIVSTVQKFPFILDEIGAEHRWRKFAIVIDAAHSSQGGRTSAAVSMALSAAGAAATAAPRKITCHGALRPRDRDLEKARKLKNRSPLFQDRSFLNPRLQPPVSRFDQPALPAAVASGTSTSRPVLQS
jgi:hypothetical protein